MSINTTFKTLIERFPTSEALFEWLRSDEGGRLVIRDTDMTPECPLVIISYDKEKSDMSKEHVGAFRSIVWDAKVNRPVCVSPARGLKFSAAVDANLEAGSFTVEDFVDGVMINMFFNGQAWQLATRTRIHADGHYYGEKPFAELFWSTFFGKGLTLEHLDKKLCYSWVLQHPDERIVVAPAYGIPVLHLVETSSIAEDGAISHAEPSVELARMRPATHELRTLEDVKDRVEAWGFRFGHQWQGVIVHDEAGKRYKLRTNQYETARMLRGNQPNRKYLWLERWSEGKLSVYLKLYPEEYIQANAIVNAYKAITQEAHDYYMKVYRRHELPLGQAPQKYRKLLWEAHQAGKGAYFANMRDFMNEQDTARKLWLINYEMRYPATTNVSAPAFTDAPPATEIAEPAAASSSPSVEASAEA